MTCNEHDDTCAIGTHTFSRREVVQAAGLGAFALAWRQKVHAVTTQPDAVIDVDKRFPYFLSMPVPYFNVRMQDTLWAPRQKTIHEVSIAWATGHWDPAGGLTEFKKSPSTYQAQIRPGDLEVINLVEAMAATVGLKRDAAIEGLIDAWGVEFTNATAPDGYWRFGWPLAPVPSMRWQPLLWSYEDYALGHYLEAAMAYREVTGKSALYDSAIRGIDEMAATFLGSDRAYAPGHEEIEQALMRLYGATGKTRYVELCRWLIDQRGNHERRRSFGKYSQDHIPVRQQRTIEGHAVRAAYLYNGVTECVGATGDAELREAALAVWSDLVEHKLYLHGVGGINSANNEGYSSKPDFIPPNDAYGESCSVFANFEWAHTLFRLTGNAAYLDVAERMLYNAFYASLSLTGDRFFYRNVAWRFEPTLRFAWHQTPCCPPNIIKLSCKVGGYFYSVDSEGIFVKHYGASEATIPFGPGIKLVQRTLYPWLDDIVVDVDPVAPVECALRLRRPDWARSHAVSVNGVTVDIEAHDGWLTIRRRWAKGDKVRLSLPMEVERVFMPARFKEYEGLVAVRRGPIVYCLEGCDLNFDYPDMFIPEETKFRTEYRPDLLGGVTVIHADLMRVGNYLAKFEGDTVLPVMFIPYGLWNNREPGWMKIWLPARRPVWMAPRDPPDAT